MIKTTRKSRALYAKHLNVNYISEFNGISGLDKDGSRTCYMCEADRLFTDDCDNCPLSYERIGGTCMEEGPQGVTKKRMNWIIEQIHKYTDCEIKDDV